MSRTESAPRIRLQLAAVTVAVTLGLTAAACSSSSKTNDAVQTDATTTTTAVAGISVPPGYKPGAKAPDAAVDAIHTYEDKNGPAPGSFTLTAVQVSPADPNYVLYRISPTPGNENEVQAGYGFARNQNAKWAVIGFGTDAVGCPPGTAENKVVPAEVLTSFQLTCP